ncbi:MAG TPA: hypothetical protein V6D47_14985 [Oscillatoriaceae cyanobacterium]
MRDETERLNPNAMQPTEPAMRGRHTEPAAAPEAGGVDVSIENEAEGNLGAGSAIVGEMGPGATQPGGTQRHRTALEP